MDLLMKQFLKINEENWKGIDPKAYKNTIDYYTDRLKRIEALATESATIAPGWRGGGPILAPIEINLRLSSNPNDLSGKIILQSTATFAVVDEKQQNTIGTLTNETGKTDFTGKFTLNGNYGTAVFIGKVNEVESSPVVITVWGETYEDAVRRIDLYKKQVSLHFTSAAANYRWWSDQIASTAQALLFISGVVFWEMPLLGIALLILAFLADAIAGRLREIADEVLKNLDEWLKDLDRLLEPELKQLPNLKVK